MANGLVQRSQWATSLGPEDECTGSLANGQIQWVALRLRLAVGQCGFVAVRYQGRFPWLR
ncbi:hypothetical protein RISK_001389 [Rhodopirellula islandica]|uniref:Uncharacterized protein n=1 Tax=Rhodopirellula islandica TaxID=595434 RepID=A0A0J1EM62_RHOIS|nr:hypothetical protein RISK_001389 [Rhodopirellula islandica]